MESRNVKVIDDHGIDRDANVICGLNYEGNNYVLYWIERDNDNDNLFVSKLVSNNDGTSNMVNIEDSMEKNNINDVVKELVTFSVNNENNVTTGDVALKNGKNVKITPVLFNKEQNINVSKTYITTVKKSVTKVGSDFYKVEETPSTTPVEEPVFDNVFEPLKEEPVVPEVPVEQPQEMPPLEPVTPSPVEVVEEPAVVPETPVMPVVEPVNEVVMPTPEPVVPTNNEPVVEPIPTSVEVPEVNQPVPVPVETPTQPELVFDGSKEVNLNGALGEVTNENVIPVNDVASLREFGQDETVNNQENFDNVPVNSDKGGFANKKFFMVIAILFFVGACVFLGYEAYQYFQLVNK